MERATPAIEGMSCAHGLDAVSAVRGAQVETVRVGMATVAYEPGSTSPDARAAAVSDEGYAACVVDG